jgi:hypothetical protein
MMARGDASHRRVSSIRMSLAVALIHSPHIPSNNLLSDSIFVATWDFAAEP